MNEPWNFTETQRRQFREAHAEAKRGQTEGDYRQLSEDVLNAANTPVWDMLADAGIDLDRITVDDDGTWHLRTGEPSLVRISFGPSVSPEDGQVRGWDWTRWGDARPGSNIEAQDWAETDEELLDVLRAATPR